MVFIPKDSLALMLSPLFPFSSSRDREMFSEKAPWHSHNHKHPTQIPTLFTFTHTNRHSLLTNILPNAHTWKQSLSHKLKRTFSHCKEESPFFNLEIQKSIWNLKRDKSLGEKFRELRFLEPQQVSGRACFTTVGNRAESENLSKLSGDKWQESMLSW